MRFPVAIAAVLSMGSLGCLLDFSGLTGGDAGSPGTTYCDALEPPPTYCVDFDREGFGLDGWTYSNRAAALTVVSEDSVSPPRSARFDMPQTTDAAAKWRRQLPGQPRRVRVGAHVKLEALQGTANILMVTVLSGTSKFTLYVFAERTGLGLAELVDTGSSPPPTFHGRSPPPTLPGDWQRVEMELTFGAPTRASAWINGTSFVADAALDARWTTGTATVLFGSDWSTQGAQVLRFDNVTVDAAP